MTVKELIRVLSEAEDMDDRVYVDVDGDALELEKTDTRVNYGFFVGRCCY